MRNVFDHYSQAENQLTHALFTALDNDRNLLGSFVKDICGSKHPKPFKLHLSVQRYPFSNRYDAGNTNETGGARPGSVLLREWNGLTYSVEVTPEGYVLEGQSFRSLSGVARRITGANWSGPRFFGLKQRAGG
jgi:hypothetical protein